MPLTVQPVTWALGSLRPGLLALLKYRPHFLTDSSCLPPQRQTSEQRGNLLFPLIQRGARTSAAGAIVMEMTVQVNHGSFVSPSPSAKAAGPKETGFRR